MFSRKNKYNSLPDRELVDLFKSANNMNALGVLFNRYAHLVASIAIGILKNEERAKDVVHEIFETIIIDLKKHDVKNFNAWIYSVTKFHCFKIKKEPTNSDAVDNIESYDDFEEILERELILQKRVEILKKSLDEIKPNQKDCIELFYFKGLSYKEVSDRTELSIKEVKSHIQNGKRNLKLLLSDNG